MPWQILADADAKVFFFRQILMQRLCIGVILILVLPHVCHDDGPMGKFLQLSDRFTCIAWTSVLCLIEPEWTELAQQFKALGVLFLGISQSMALLRMSSVFGPLNQINHNESLNN